MFSLKLSTDRVRTPRVMAALAAALAAALPVSAPTRAVAEEPLPWAQPPAGPPAYGSNDEYARDYYARDQAPQGRAPGPAYGYQAPQARDAAPPPSQDGYSAAPPAAGTYARNDSYRAPYPGGPGDAYAPGASAQAPRNDSFSDPGEPINGGSAGYGEPYAPPPQPGESYQQAPASPGTYEQGEIIATGHSFFGAVSQSLASAVEYAFQSQGRPNGYILGEDAGGALILGLRYGEGTLYTKDAGDHKVFWQGPSVGYDAGAEGSKTMVLVYNLRDPAEIYNRFGGVQGSAYLVGGVSVQFQKYGDVTLGIIRSGLGLRLGANVGYLKYTRSPTWNPL